MLLHFAFLFSLCLPIQTQTPEDRVSAGHFASGIKIGEVTQDSAIVWARLTQDESADFDQLKIFSKNLRASIKSKERMPIGVVPGTAGCIQLLCWEDAQADSEPLIKQTQTVAVANDFAAQFQLKNLRPGIRYKISLASMHGETMTNKIVGRFRTAPEKTESVPIRFIVSTCQAVRSIDAGTSGHLAYRTMTGVQPDFFIHTGDILYYDKVPLCKTIAEARAKWNLMFAFKNNQEFFRQTSSYFMKDDHDTLKNDCWPGQTYGELTFADGLKIFREQVPMGASTYRTFRWGKHCQIWLTENRDFRSNNRNPDGPEKTILGEEQKTWLMQSLQSSEADFKFVVSPGPIVGPDKKGKNDNHSNTGFFFEGNQLREFLSKQSNTFVICGDRHWQYCSQDPETSLIEMGCGPINDEHMFGGNPGFNDKFHRFFSGKGGFLLVTVSAKQVVAEWMSGTKMSEKGDPRLHHKEVFDKKS